MGWARSASGQPSRDALLLIVGQDTISTERFLRTADRLESELFLRAQNIRLSLSATLRADGSVARMEHAVRIATADRTAPPQQSAVLTFTGDSVVADVTAPTHATQRLGTTSGAIPYVNPSFAILELVVRRAQHAGGDSVSVPGFRVAGGTTFEFAVKRLGSDSVILSIAGVATRLAVTPNGDILGGIVPAQGVRIVRVRGMSEAGMTARAPDYSAPPGAPYSADEVSVPTKDGFVLKGTLTMPKSAKGPVPAMVMITGSGQEDRDEAIPGVSGYRPFRQIADTLSRHGIAVLRLDDRGIGGSGGDAARATSKDFADDVKAALAFLRSRHDIDGRRLGLIGHSEGGLIAPLVALEDSLLRGIVLMAGPAWTGRRIVEYQNRFMLDQTPNMPSARKDSLLKSAMQTVDSIARTTPWLGFFLSHDPLTVARRVHTPVLILQGATDRQVTAEQANELAEAFRAGGNRDVSVHVFPNTNHLFVGDPDGNPRGYPALPVHAVRSDVLGMLLEWVEKRF